MDYQERNYGKGILSCIPMKNQSDRPHLILGQNIADRRGRLGYTNAVEFAEKAGIGLSGLRDIERGVSEGRIETRQAIAQLLKCSVADLYEDKVGSPRTQDFAAAASILSTFANLPLPFQKTVLALIYNDSIHVRSLPDKVRRPLEVLLKAL